MVTRCVCFDVPFLTMKQIIVEHGVEDVDALRTHIQFGEKCRLCVPYVERIFSTGATEFEAVFDDGED